jgi:DNA-binding PadR family transcriptional regulator
VEQVNVKSLEERLTLAKTILREVSREPLSRTELDKRVTRKIGTHASFEGMFRYLIHKGCIEKSGQKLRDFYRITEKGRKMLEGLP